MPVARASSDAFHAIADPTRRAILEALAPEGVRRTAGELGERFSLRQPTVSQHLKVLREAGLVTARDEGRCRIYELRLAPLEPVKAWMEGVMGFDDVAGHVWSVKSKKES